MNRVMFDFSLMPSRIQSDHALGNISTMTSGELKSLCEGCLYLMFEPDRQYIVLRTGLIDYVMQIHGVIQAIEDGADETVAVSGDYYSNNIVFKFTDDEDVLEIIDANGGEFAIKTQFSQFREEFYVFFAEVRTELLVAYPELATNSAFVGEWSL